MEEGTLGYSSSPQQPTAGDRTSFRSLVPVRTSPRPQPVPHFRGPSSRILFPRFSRHLLAGSTSLIALPAIWVRFCGSTSSSRFGFLWSLTAGIPALPALASTLASLDFRFSGVASGTRVNGLLVRTEHRSHPVCPFRSLGWLAARDLELPLWYVPTVRRRPG